MALTTIPILTPTVICNITLPRVLVVIPLAVFGCESRTPGREDVQTCTVTLGVAQNRCCFGPDYSPSIVSLWQTPNHMPRLDCPSVSAETPNPIDP